MDAVDQLFAEFELVYHNQFHKAFPSVEKLVYAKKLWFSQLCEFPADRILQASKRATRESEFLPTIRGIIKYCEPSPEEHGLPDAYQAYVEACRAASPKHQQIWSHPAVYLAGQDSDWFFLANNTENKAFPVYKRNYEKLCERVLQGESLDIPEVAALPEQSSTPLSKEENQARMQKLRAELNL